MLPQCYQMLGGAHSKTTGCFTSVIIKEHFVGVFVFVLGGINESFHGSCHRHTDVFVFQHRFIMLLPLFQRTRKSPKINDVLVSVMFSTVSIGSKFGRVKTLRIVLFVVFPMINPYFQLSIVVFVDIPQFAINFVVGSGCSQVGPKIVNTHAIGHRSSSGNQIGEPSQ